MPATKLNAEQVIEGAVRLADRIGVDALTIRKIADEIDAKPMTIYHHVPNKNAIIDGMVDHVFSEISLPPADVEWRSAMLTRCRSMRAVLADHPWAARLMDSNLSAGPATMKHHDAVLGCLRNAGFSLQLTAHAYALIDAFLYGFALQEATLPATEGEEVRELAESVVDEIPEGAHPHLTEFATQHVLQPDYSFGDSFEVGLDLILNGLERAAAAET